MAELIKALDEALMSQEEYHAEWWRRQRLTASTHTETLLTKECISSPSVKWLSAPLGSRLSVPHGAVSSGLHVLSAHGSTCDRLLAVSPHYALGASASLALT
eukprot:437819-Prymnesium_polylepis.1